MPKTQYKTPDGKYFDDFNEAQEHERKYLVDQLLVHNKKLEQIKNTYWWNTWGCKIDPKSEGFWEIRGEDPNCDVGGHHHNPLISVVSGTFEKALNYAADSAAFFTWGYGGDIKKMHIEVLQ